MRNVIINDKLKKDIEMIKKEIYTLYSGITLEAWNNIWRDKNLANKTTNVTSDLAFSLDYSYNFTTGKYEDLAIEISNIPLEAFVSVRQDDYEDDDDFDSLNGLSKEDKKNLIESSTLFLLNLQPYKSQIEIKLIRT